MATKKLKVNVIAGRNFSSKNGANKNDPYCEIVVLDDQGNKIGKSQSTKVLKATLDPSWNQLIEFPVGSSFSGLKITCWDKHKFRADKFLGQVTIKFNTALLQSAEQLDDWFTLSKRKAKEEVSGQVHLQIQYGDVAKDKKDEKKEVASSPKSPEMNTQPSSLDVRVSANFTTDETNAKLKNSTHVVVVETEEEDDGEKDNEEYEKTREGPSIACLEKINKDDKDISLTNKNLEVTNNTTNYYSVEYVKGNVKVNGGKWYYEIRIQASGQMHVGWSTKNYDPKKNEGDIWWFDGSRQIKQKNAQGSERYGESWGNGDIIGCSIDVESRSIQFWKNGKDLGVAFNDVATTHGRFCPVIGLSKRARCQVNFGKDTFAYPQNGFNMLHSNLSEKEVEQLSKLFSKYKEIGNEALIAEAKEEGKEAEPKENIAGSGTLEFSKDLGVTDDDDPILMIIAWKLKTETLWEISREEFMNGFTIAGCATVDKIKSKAHDWRNDIKTNEKDAKQFYNFVFDYLKEEKKILPIDEAIVAWNITLKDRKWPLFPEFMEFLKAEEKKAVSRDAWQQLWHFMIAYPSTLKDYDTSSSWPIVFDEFVEYWQAKHKSK